MALSDVVGHEKQTGMLRYALKAGRVSSSYLFSGESGVGKKFAAVNFAKALNCQRSTGLPGISASDEDRVIDACDECQSCRKMDSGTHPDFTVIGPEKGVIKVDEIRRIEDALSLKPYEAAFKVVIVDDAETMNQNAANAFLKTLEEPPPQSVIILVSSSPELLLETIRSRCVRINFRPLSPEDCKAVLKKEAEKTGGAGSYTDGGIAALSMGRPGLAVHADLLKERARFMEVLKAITVEKRPLWQGREDIEAWLDMLFCILRDMAVFKIEGAGGHLINTDIPDVIRDMSARTDLKVIIECYEKMSRLRGYLRFNLNKTITWNYTGSVLGGLQAPAKGL